MRVVDNVGFNVKKQDIPGGGSGSGQPLATPDWNQNDKTAADYIKNRPFYTTDPVETELVNGTFAFTVSGSMYYTSDIVFDLVEGQTYKVTLDGVEYETVCQNYHGALYIGSIEILAGGTPEYPFVYMPMDGTFATSIEGVSHEIVIKELKTQIVPIPDKYISDTFRTVVHARDPRDWSKLDWSNYYNLFQSGKLLKIISSSNRPFEGYVLSMLYDDRGAYRMSAINFSGEILNLRQNSKGYYWEPSLYFDTPSGDYMFNFKYYLDGDYSGTNGENYKRLETSNNVLIFTTKETAKNSVKRKVVLEGDKELILSSSTAGSTKKFKITVDDSGTLTATEVTG